VEEHSEVLGDVLLAGPGCCDELTDARLAFHFPDREPRI
jgi:hypothetical protein